MIATLKYIEHYCLGHPGECGDMLTPNKVRKVFLYVDGKPKYVGTQQGAQDYAKEHGLEVQDA